MAGILRVDQIKNTSASGNIEIPAGYKLVAADAGAISAPGTVVQIATSTVDGILSTSVNGAATTITNGVEVFSTAFTPKFATSVILVTTSTVMIHEESNVADICWLALWDGSTFIAANSGTAKYTNFGGSLNFGYTSLNHTYSAGSTSTRTISVRAGFNGGGTVYVNGNTYSAWSGSSARLQMTVWEIAQ